MEELFGCRLTCATPHLRLPRRARPVFGSLRTQAMPRTAAATGLRLLLGSCESYGGHSYSQHKITSHLWHRNPSPNLQRCRCCSVAGHNHRPKKLGRRHTWLGRLRRPTKHPLKLHGWHVSLGLWRKIWNSFTLWIVGCPWTHFNHHFGWESIYVGWWYSGDKWQERSSLLEVNQF